MEKMGKIDDVAYEILNVLEFNRWSIFPFILMHIFLHQVKLTFLLSLLNIQYKEASVCCVPLSRWQARFVLQSNKI